MSRTLKLITHPYNLMKKSSILCILTGIACGVAGFCMNQIMHSSDAELIDAQNAALEKAEIVMDNNDLFDADGSDDMADYLELCCEVDSLRRTIL